MSALSNFGTVPFSSSVLFVIALTLTTIWHELGHTLAGLALRSDPILHHIFVEHRPLSGRRKALIAAAGPCASLLQGLAFWAVQPFARAAPPRLRLFLLWMALHGMSNFVGYLVLTPFARGADTGQIADVLGLRRWARFAVGAVGLLGTYALGWATAAPFLALAPSPSAVGTESARATFVLHLAVLPWIAGAVLSTAVRIPAVHPTNLIYPLASGIFVIPALSRARVLEPVPGAIADWSTGSDAFWFLLCIGLLVLFRGPLARGIHFTWARRPPAESDRATNESSDRHPQ